MIPTLPIDALPLAKLAPDRNSLRLATAGAMAATAAAVKPGNTAKGQKRKREDGAVHMPVAQEGGAPAGKGGSVQALRLPTPHYNTSIIVDLVVEQHQQVLQSAFDAVPRLREAIVLLKVGYCGSCFTPHSFCYAAFGFTSYMVLRELIDVHHVPEQ